MRKNTGSKHLTFSVLAADVALFSVKDGELVVRLMNVHRPPHFVDIPGLPGGLVRPEETAEDTVRRLIQEKGCVRPDRAHIEQLQTYTALDRDPRGRVVSVAYIALIPWTSLSEEERAEAAEAWWLQVSRARRVKLAYDHAHILRDALVRLAEKTRSTTIISKLLPPEFTMFELRSLYEKILGKPIDKRNFIKKIRSLGILKSLGRKEIGRKVRPAELFSFASKKIESAAIM